MSTKKLVTLLLTVFSLQSYAEIKMITCPRASDVVPEGKQVSDYQDYLRANNIVPMTALSANFLEQFKNEFSKFPERLHKEMMKAGLVVHIMEGEGVTVDPTWDKNEITTFDGRPWSEVPGSGGSTAKGFLMNPTRVVINHLYDKQGSVNMLIHEHAHSLDSIESTHGISHSQVWTDLLADEPKAMEFLEKICVAGYCSNNVQEGFAELFSHYYSCEESRAQMEREIPKIADFFRRFDSVKRLKNIWSDGPVVEEAEEVKPAPSYGPRPEIPRPRRTKERCATVFGRKICI